MTKNHIVWFFSGKTFWFWFWLMIPCWHRVSARWPKGLPDIDIINSRASTYVSRATSEPTTQQHIGNILGLWDNVISQEHIRLQFYLSYVCAVLAIYLSTLRVQYAHFHFHSWFKNGVSPGLQSPAECTGWQGRDGQLLQRQKAARLCIPTATCVAKFPETGNTLSIARKLETVGAPSLWV